MKNATNCEIVWFQKNDSKMVSVQDQKKQSDIYALKHTYGFPMTDPAKYQELSENDKQLLVTNEPKFLLNRINSSDQDEIRTLLLPKSLYQLFVFKQYLDDINNENPIRNEYAPDDSLNFSNELIKICSENTHEACKLYLCNDSIQKQYWALNELIIAYLCTKIDFDQGVTEESISPLLDSLLENISKTVISNNSKIKIFWGLHARDCTVIYKMLRDKKLEQIKSFILPVITCEYQIANNDNYNGTYMIYRGQGKDSDNPLKARAALSFSDGVFGGIIFDSVTGMAFDYFCKLKHMIAFSISKKDYLDGATAFFIPPLSIFGNTNGRGEFHHPRMLYFYEGNSEEDEIPGIDMINIDGIEANTQTMPWLCSNKKELFDQNRYIIKTIDYSEAE